MGGDGRRCRSDSLAQRESRNGEHPPAEPRRHQHQLTSAVILIGCMTLLMTGHDRERKYTTDWHRNSGTKQRAEQRGKMGSTLSFFVGVLPPTYTTCGWITKKKPPSNVYNYAIQVRVTSAMMTAKRQLSLLGNI